ncbi:MAG: hypothetical protein M1834_006490 [Cirrosporium novae-zelandiae]|nr:MAG: hypothetical protein M1834_006490 [Cirrosporium novae-zelandiae]
MPLSQDEEVQYTAIIDSILAKSDLEKVTAKQIKNALQREVDRDLTAQKGAIKELIMARFDEAAGVGAEADQKPNDLTNGHGPTPDSALDTTESNHQVSETPSSDKSPKKRKDNSEDDDLSDVPSTPPKKRQRKQDSIEDDEAYAKRLQAEENLRARPTRGGATRKAAAPKKKKRAPAKAKSAKKIRAEDDSGAESSGSDVKKERKVNRNSGFHKELTLSPNLSALLNGETKLSRPQTVKKIWEYIKANNLQDPNDKRQILCDEIMKSVFKTDRIHMFTMNKVLNQNLYDEE